MQRAVAAVAPASASLQPTISVVAPAVASAQEVSAAQPHAVSSPQQDAILPLGVFSRPDTAHPSPGRRPRAPSALLQVLSRLPRGDGLSRPSP